MYKEFVDFDSDLDVPVSKAKEVDKLWLTDKDDETNEKFKATLLDRAAQRIFNAEREILLKRYRAAQARKFDFTNPNATQQMFYNEGYLQALRDMYKILPRP